MNPVLDIIDLQVHFDTADARVHAVKGVDIHLNAGECLGIVGESGSGKSQSFMALMGLLAANGRASGEAWLGESELLGLSVSQLNKIRGNRLSMIFQDPLTSLTPHMRIGDQMSEVLRLHQKLDKKTARFKIIDWLERVHIPDAQKRLYQYPHELSGGMRQRVMIAMAMLCQPDVLIADEPTTALDVTIQAEILDLMNELRSEHGTAIVLITHDMGVVARMCDRVQVMRYGEFVESGTCRDIFYHPQHDYTRRLLDAVPRIPATVDDAPDASAPLRHAKTEGYAAVRPEKTPVSLKVDNLRVEFAVGGSLFRSAQVLSAVDGISFGLRQGEALGIVGESGSGKSTLARAILQLLPQSTGSVQWLGQSLSDLDKPAMTRLRRDLQIVFQDPLASLNPSITIGDSIMEPLRVHEPALALELRIDRVAKIMKRVGLELDLINRYPHELSGGQNQRVGIARAMILQPALLICDEAVSALDVSIQAQVLALIKSLQQEYGLSLIFISHDLAVVHEIADRIAVMYLGNVMELANTRDIFHRPQHPYTRQLVSAVPVADPDIEQKRHRVRLMGELTSPMDPKARLRFLPSKLQHGAEDYKPALQERFPGHFVTEHDPLETLILPV